MHLCRLTLVLALCTAPTIAARASTQPTIQAWPGATNAARLVDEVDEMIAKGRALLDAGQPSEAEAVFAAAAEEDGQSLRTRMWVLRAWMELGRGNDALDGIDALRDARIEGDEIDYLYGMAFVKRAEQMVANGAVGSEVGMNIRDGYALLREVMPRNERRFRDGWLALARVGWREAGSLADPNGANDLEGAATARRIARDAADRAAAFYPHHPDVHLARGRIALSQFVSDLPEGVTSPEEWGAASAHWDMAVRSFSAVLQLAKPSKEDPRSQLMMGIAGMQLGNTLMWKAERARAAQAYARGIAWAPWNVDFRTIFDQLYDASAEEPYAHVISSLESGQKGFEGNFGADLEGDATTLWWLGWACLSAGERNGEAARYFERAVAKWPDYSDSWYYVALARYGEEDWAAAAKALAVGWDADPTMMLELMNDAEIDLNVARVEYLKGWSYGAGELETAVALAALNAETRPKSAVFWNDLGLFLRERGNQLREGGEPVEPEVLGMLDHRAWDAYSRALDIEPKNPQLLNDGAVILQYYLKRDLDKARNMYEQAVRLADEALASGDLEESATASIAKARSDALKNLAELDAPQDARR